MMKLRIFLLASAILFFGGGLAFAQTKDFTAEVTHTLAPGETREDAHVLAVSEARFKVVDQILAYLKSELNFAAKKFSPDNQRMTAYIMIKSQDVQEQWINSNACAVSYRTMIDTTQARRILKDMAAGSDPYKGKGFLSDNQRIVDSLRLVLNLTAQGEVLENDRRRLLEEYALLEIRDRSKGLQGEARIAVITEALETRPASAELLGSRGYAYAENKQYDLALKDFAKAIELDPDNLGAYLGRASVYKSVSLEEKALADYGHVIQIDPTIARAYSSRALIYKNQDKIDLALADYLRAITLEPKDRFSLQAVGYIYYGREDFDKALEYFNKEIDVAPDLQGGYTSRGYIYMRQEQYDKAIEDFTKALEIDPEYAHGLNYMNRSNAYLQKGDKEKARADLEKAVALGETRAQALLRQLPLTK